MSILKLRDFHCSSVGRKGLDFAVDQQFYIYYILVPEALKVREAISSDQYFCSFSFYHLDINCHYFKVNNLNLSENVKSVVHTIIYMYIYIVYLDTLIIISGTHLAPVPPVNL